MRPYQVTVRRTGVSPLSLTMTVAAATPEEAAGVATTVAERDRGGMFEVRRVRAPRGRWSVPIDRIAA